MYDHEIEEGVNHWLVKFNGKSYWVKGGKAHFGCGVCVCMYVCVVRKPEQV